MSLKLKLMCAAMRHARKKARKKQPWIGKQLMMKRENAPEVELFLYEPKEKRHEPLPVLFNVHGGAWVGGDATALDTQSQFLADMLSAFVVNINYRKLDEVPFPYPQTEVCDTVLYFQRHAEEYGLDKTCFNLIGYSAGGHICAGAAMLLRDAGVKLCSQILCYPFLDFHIFEGGNAVGMDGKTVRLMNELFFRGGMDANQPMMSPASAPADALHGMAPAEIILCGPDDLYQQGIDYQKHLESAGVDAALKVFEPAIHGFLEANYPENFGEKNESQIPVREECWQYLKERLEARWS